MMNNAINRIMAVLISGIAPISLLAAVGQP